MPASAGRTCRRPATAAPPSSWRSRPAARTTSCAPTPRPSTSRAATRRTGPRRLRGDRRLRHALPDSGRRRRRRLADPGARRHDRLLRGRDGLAPPPRHRAGLPQAAARLRLRRGAARAQVAVALQSARARHVAGPAVRRRERARRRCRSSSIYGGSWGSAPYQSIYERSVSTGGGAAHARVVDDDRRRSSSSGSSGLTWPPLLLAWPLALAMAGRRSS